MNFDEWLENNRLGNLLSVDTICNMRTAWNAAIDEAVKAAKEDAKQWLAPSMAKSALLLADKIKELKE